MKQVLRVEHSDGLGMFQPFNKFMDDEFREHSVEGLESLTPLLIRHRHFNNPQEDKLDLWKDNKLWFCAYKNIAQFEQWVMKPEIEILIEAGYRFYSLQVSEYQEGEHQFIFTKESIESKEDVTELFMD